jgi:YVTN family beta-propeller protein
VQTSARILIGAVFLTACHSVPIEQPTTQSGTIAVSADGTHLYVADADNNQLVIVDVERKSVSQTVPIGKEPSHVVVAADGRVFVSNRQSRSISVIDPAKGVETKRIAVGTEPTAMVFAEDGQTLLVTNTTNATVSVINVASLAVRDTLTLDTEDPSGLALLPDGRVFVTHTRSGTVTVLAKGTFQPTKNFSLDVPLPQLMLGKETTSPGQPTSPVIDAWGRVIIPHSQSDLSPVTTLSLFMAPTKLDDAVEVDSPYAGGSFVDPVTGLVDPFVHPPIVMPALAMIDPKKDDRILGSTENFNLPTSAPIVPPTILTVRDQSLAGPSAAVVDPNGRFLYVAHLNSNNVAFLPLTNDPKVPKAPASTLQGQNVSQIIGVGAGPNGLAVPPSGDRVYVYNSFDHTVSVLKAKGASIVQDEVIGVGSTSLTPEQDLGRRLFFSASDRRMTSTSAGGIACASCHPGGREDGRTWQFTEGPRNTPTLAGRHLRATAPYHWDGALTTMHAFNQVITSRMGGAGDGTSGGLTDHGPLEETDFNAILAFVDGLSPPDNPYRDSADPAVVSRGKEIFQGKAGCAACHIEATDFTDNDFHSVGTVGFNIVGIPESFPIQGLVNTPTLHNLFATAPYLHNGSAPTLRARIDDDMGGLHGSTSGLNEDERVALVTYLKTL